MKYYKRKRKDDEGISLSFISELLFPDYKKYYRQ